MVASSGRELGLQLLLVHCSEAESSCRVWNLHHPQLSPGLWWSLVHSLSNVAASCGQRLFSLLWSWVRLPPGKPKVQLLAGQDVILWAGLGLPLSSLPTQERAGSQPRQKQKSSSIPGPSHYTPASLLPGSSLLPFPSEFWVILPSRQDILLKYTYTLCVCVNVHEHVLFQECEIILPLFLF